MSHEDGSLQHPHPESVSGLGDAYADVVPLLLLCQESFTADFALLVSLDDAGIVKTVASTTTAGPQIDWSTGVTSLLRPRRIVDLRRLRGGCVFSDEGLELRSMVTSPVMLAGEQPMAIVLLSYKSATFSRSDQAFLTYAGELMARAITLGRLKARTAAKSSPDAPAETAESRLGKVTRTLDSLIEWQGHLVEITNNLMVAHSVDVDAAINGALAKTGQLANSDRTYVFRLRDQDRLDNTHEWVSDNIAPMIGQLQDLPIEIIADWKDDLSAGQSIYIPVVSDLPDASSVKVELLSQGIKSLLAVPMIHNGQLKGFVGYDAVRQHREFLPTEIQLIQSVANTINVVIERVATETAERIARERFESQNKRLRATIAAIPDLVLELDADGRYVGGFVGGALQPIRPIADHIGNTLEDVLPPDTAALCRKVMGIVDRDGLSTDHEYQIIIDKELRYHQMSAASISQDSGMGYLFLVRDITDSRRQQQQILRLGKVAELTSNLVAVMDIEGRFEWVNPAFEQQSGWRLDEIIGKEFESFLNTESINSAARDLIRSALKNGGEVQTELLNKNRFDEKYWTNVDISTLRDGAGILTGFVAVQTDITEMKQTHAREVQDLAVAIEEAKDGIALMGADGCFTCASQTFRTLFGIGLMEDIASLAMADFYPDPVPQGEVDVLLARDGFWRIERTAVLRDGTQFPHWFSLSRRALGGYLCIVHDISSRLKMEAEHAFLLEELQIAQRRDAIAELATGVAHDLNNLVGVVDGTADLIEMQATGNSAILAGTQRIKRATGMARELVSNLGRLDRPDSPRATLDLRVLAKQVYGLLGSTRISDHSIKIIVPEMPISILANATDVQQVLVNLAINACDAKEGATNVVNMAVLPKDAGPPSFAPSIGMMYPDKQYAFVVVSDTGNGIMPELREKLFTRYFTTKGDKGTGLGLPIVATILRENDAVLWLDTTPGVGTVVTIGWPLGLVDLSTNEPRGAGPSFDGSELSGARILVVDDVADMGQVLAEMLGAAGATTVRIDDAAKALELISDEAEHWSALVTDLDMPGLSGFDLAIAAAKRNPPLPVVLVTALVESVGRRKDQFSSILQKPTKAERLIDAVRKVISSR